MYITLAVLAIRFATGGGQSSSQQQQETTAGVFGWPGGQFLVGACGLVLIGVGIALMVTPLTSAVLGSVPQSEAGSGSAVNNAVARIAGLVTVALAGVVLGGEVSVDGLHRARKLFG